MKDAHNVPTATVPRCRECDRPLRPHGDCMFCPECGELFAKIDIPRTSPDGDNFGFVTTGTKVRGRWSPARRIASGTRRKTDRRVKQPTATQGGLFDA